MADSQATDYRIIVLEGPFKGQATVLAGRALPYSGVSYETEQRIKTTYYPGNSVATQQVMGAIDQPTTISGTWKDIFLRDGVAQQLVETFDGLCRSGVLVEVQWGDAILPDGTPRNAVVRRGLIKKFKATYDRPQDIPWEMTFEWRGRDEATAPPLTSAGLINNRSGLEDVSSKFSTSLSALDAFRTGFVNRLVGITQQAQDQFDDAQLKVASAIGFITDTTDAINSATDVSLDIISRSRGIFSAGASALRDLCDTVDRLDDLTLEVRDSALDFLDLRAQKINLCRSADDAQAAANENTASMGGQETPEVQAEIRVPAGTDLREIARQQYGDAELWFMIADFNGLTSSRVPDLPSGPSDSPGRPILVPRRAEGRASSVGDVC